MPVASATRISSENSSIVAKVIFLVLLITIVFVIKLLSNTGLK
jgi:hypothetical protein